jgi:catalase
MAEGTINTRSPRSQSLLADFQLREKMMRFDHERIPERVVHARGCGAHGYFEAYQSLTPYTRASFLSEASKRTPVFVRFSTFQGSRGSVDTPRDVRGFATKFYTDQGNFDLVGNNMPVFFIKDGLKFPELVHALKPEPRNEMPQATSAHDTFWDFISRQPETMHHVIWMMSDRALPRSYAMMQGFGVHTFRLVNAGGRVTFAKFHWRPALGTHSLVWDEAQLVAGRDPDFNRRDLWDAIEAGNYPEWELGLQLIDEADEFAYGIDLLDPTKVIPEEVVPVTPVGRMVLDRNPDNFFEETELVAFSVGNLVPGVDVTDDPLMQARMFSYSDTQLSRLGGPNPARIPINRPVAVAADHQHDAFPPDDDRRGGVAPEEEKRRVAARSDDYSQATLFWNSMSGWEKDHIVAAYRFELGKVTGVAIRERMVIQLNQIDHELAVAVAAGIGVEPPAPVGRNHGRLSPALSQAAGGPAGVRGRKLAILVADGVNRASVASIVDAFATGGATVELLAAVAGSVSTDDGGRLPVTRAMTTVGSVLYDAVAVADGEDCAALLAGDGFAVHFIAEAYKHAKAVGAVGAGVNLLDQAKVLAPGGAQVFVTAPDEGLLGEQLTEAELLDDDPAREAGDDAVDAAYGLGEERTLQEMADADLAGAEEDLGDEITDDSDIAQEIDSDALLDAGVVIDSEAVVDFLAAFLAAVGAHRHFTRPVNSIAA